MQKKNLCARSEWMDKPIEEMVEEEKTILANYKDKNF